VTGEGSPGGGVPVRIRTVLGDLSTAPQGYVYSHEHLVIDSPLIVDRFPEILHDSVEEAVTEVGLCAAAGVCLMVDAMPCASGRDADKLADISRRTGVGIVAATGLHHDRYYGPQHWSNRVSVEELADLFVADLEEGIDAFDYTGPIVRRTPHRAGILKVATSGAELDDRDRRNLDAVAMAALRTGAPILTHCEAGAGGLQQIERLGAAGIPASAVILSHVDKSSDRGYLEALLQAGASLELDQLAKHAAKGVAGPSIGLIARLVSAGFGGQLVVGTDGARRTLWRSLGGTPGLAWIAAELPGHLRQVGVADADIARILRENALKALTWQSGANGRPSDADGS
jgi:predicted metal-dependent phosphotriesterase family hydrolase